MKHIDYKAIIQQIYEESQTEKSKGQVATYIPALAEVSPQKFGIAITTVEGEEYAIGDAAERFSIQSISKIFTLTMAMKLVNDEIWKRVGKEPSGNAFNSLVQLEYENGKPRNPFINAGALVISDFIVSKLKEPKKELLQLVRKLSNCPTVDFDAQVAISEKQHGSRNAALAFFMKSFGNIESDVDALLDFYFNQCSLSMSCLELSRAFVYLANRGKSLNLQQVATLRQTKRINAIMLTCGMYDAVGEFAYRVGLPSKSGVGGGIVAVVPNRLCISVWSPALNASGNSTAGTMALELFTTYAENSIF